MIQETIEFINNKTKGLVPEVGIILGSGLGDFADNLEGIRLKYTDIPGFANSTVSGHKGQLVFTKIGNKNVVIMQGRFHYYEGYHISKVVYPIKVMKKLGAKTLLVTNAAGGVNKDYKSGDLMIIKDHINLMGTNPLIGENDATLGERFPDMTEIYKKSLIELTKEKANQLGIFINEGVYAAMSGPSYETPAEIKMLQVLGADAVGMSTVPEALVANYCKMNVLGISCITNPAAGINNTALSHEEVVETADKIKENFQNLIISIVDAL